MEFTYNHEGIRTQKVKKVNGEIAETTDYLLYGKKIIRMTKGSDALLFHYDEKGSPIMMRMNGTPYTYVKNLQGDIVGLIDSTGALVVEYKYDAWGNPISTRTLTSEYDTLTELNPFRYRGYVWDEERDIYYLLSRYYNSYINKFLNADTSSKHIVNFSTTNLFAYCRNTPVHTIDPDGKDLYVITASSGASGFGHTSLLIQDVNGEWYYYYYGPVDPDDKNVKIGKDVPAVVIYKKLEGISINENNDDFFAAIQPAIDEAHREVGLQIYDRVILMRGDFTKSHRAASDQFDNRSEEIYNLYTNNCALNSCEIVNSTIPYFEWVVRGVAGIKTNAATTIIGSFILLPLSPSLTATGIGASTYASTITPNVLHDTLEKCMWLFR